MATQVSNKIILKNVRISYANLFEPKSVGEGDKAKLKYSTALIIPHDHPQVEKLKDMADAIGKSKFGSGWGAIKRKKPTLRDYWAEYKKARQEAEEEGEDPNEISRPDESVKGAYVLNVSSTRKPQIVDRSLQPILDDAEIYSGCYCNVSIGGFAFDVESNKGVGFGLNNVQLVKQGERLGGAPNADEEFDEMDDEDDGFEMS